MSDEVFIQRPFFLLISEVYSKNWSVELPLSRFVLIFRFPFFVLPPILQNPNQETAQEAKKLGPFDISTIW